MIAFFRDLSPAQAAQAGGKGRALAELRQAGVPVPNGFVLLPASFEGDELRWQHCAPSSPARPLRCAPRR